MLYQGILDRQGPGRSSLINRMIFQISVLLISCLYSWKSLCRIWIYEHTVLQYTIYCGALEYFPSTGKGKSLGTRRNVSIKFIFVVVLKLQCNDENPRKYRALIQKVSIHSRAQWMHITSSKSRVLSPERVENPHPLLSIQILHDFPCFCKIIPKNLCQYLQLPLWF